MRLTVGFLASVNPRSSLELLRDKMDLEAAIRMPEDRGRDRLFGRIHWAKVSENRPMLHRGKWELPSG